MTSIKKKKIHNLVPFPSSITYHLTFPKYFVLIYNTWLISDLFSGLLIPVSNLSLILDHYGTSPECTLIVKYSSVKPFLADAPGPDFLYIFCLKLENYCMFCYFVIYMSIILFTEPLKEEDQERKLTRVIAKANKKDANKQKKNGKTNWKAFVIYVSVDIRKREPMNGRF